MSSGSMKDLLKAINSYLTDAAVPLPTELLDVIQSFLDKHEPIEDSDSQRLHEELIALYHKDVCDTPNRYTFFLALLCTLRPVLKGKRLLEWWDILYLKIFGSITEEKGLANEAQNILLEILVYEEDGDGSAEAAKISGALFDTLVKVWLDNCDVEAAQDPAAHLIKSQIQHVLITFGRKRTKEFLAAINELFVQKKHRLQVLPLLCRLIQSQPPRLHELLQTPLFNNLLRCLTQDTSTTVVSLAISALVMFLPHIPFSMSKHLPSLFNIYSRLLFWDRQCNSGPQDDGNGPESVDTADSSSDCSEVDTTWEKISYSFETDDSKVPELLQYFTFLYGLYPINFMDYVRKPQRYLRHANYPGYEKVDIEPLEIRQRSESYRQLHLLHPNFFNMTIESELADANRFMKIDAPDIVTNCMALCTPMYAIVDSSVINPGIQDSRHVNHLDDDIPDLPLLDQEEAGKIEQHQDQGLPSAQTSTVGSPENNRVSRLIRKASIIESAASPFLMPQEDSPTLGPNLRLPASRASLQEMLISQKNLRGIVMANGSSHSEASSVLNQDANSSIESQPHSIKPQSLHSKSPSLHPHPGDYVASLQREIMLLKNDLNFERYLKQQHLSHIGQLRRRNVREATVEAETQNLINSNRSLKIKLEEAKRSNLQAKKEAEKSRNQLKKWEADLTLKLRVLRGEQKKWNAEGETLRRDLQIAQDNCKKLTQLVVDGEAKELFSNQRVESMKHAIEENENLKLELENQIQFQRDLEVLQNESHVSKENEALACSKVEMLTIKLQARDADIEEAKKYYESQIDDLRLRLGEITRDMRRKQLEGFQKMLDSAVSSSRAKILDLELENKKLLKRFTKLEYKYMKLQEHQNLDHDQPSLLRDSHYYHGESSITGHYIHSPIRKIHTMSDADTEPSLSGSPSTRAPIFSSSFPDRPHYGHPSGSSSPSKRLDTPTSPSPSSKIHTHIGKQKNDRKFLDSDTGDGSGSDRRERKKKGGGGLKGIRGFV